MPSPSKFIANQTRLAEEINAHFKIPCTKQQIQRWQRKHTPPFPPGNANGQYVRKPCFDWVQKHIIEPMEKEGGKDTTQEILHRAVLAKAQREIDRARREKVLADEAEGLYIERTEARLKAIAVLRQYHAIVCSEIEELGPKNRMERLQNLGASPEIIAAFYAFDIESEQKRIDRITAKCQEAAKEVNAINI